MRGILSGSPCTDDMELIIAERLRRQARRVEVELPNG